MFAPVSHVGHSVREWVHDGPSEDTRNICSLFPEAESRYRAEKFLFPAGRDGAFVHGSAFSFGEVR